MTTLTKIEILIWQINGLISVKKNFAILQRSGIRILCLHQNKTNGNTFVIQTFLHISTDRINYKSFTFKYKNYPRILLLWKIIGIVFFLSWKLANELKKLIYIENFSNFPCKSLVWNRLFYFSFTRSMRKSKNLSQAAIFWTHFKRFLYSRAVGYILTVVIYLFCLMIQIVED